MAGFIDSVSNWLRNKNNVGGLAGKLVDRAYEGRVPVINRIGEGLATPQINRVQQQIEVQNEAQRQHIMKRARQQPDPVKREKLFDIVRRIQTPNVLQEAAPSIADPNYHRNIGKDILNVATAAIPAIRVPGAIAKASPAVRLAGSGAIRGLENAAFEGGRQIIDRKFDPQALKNAALMGAALNTALSPKLSIQAGKQIGGDFKKAFTIDPATGKLVAKPGFAKVPEAKTPRVTETQGRAELSGKAGELPNSNLVKGTTPEERFAEVLGMAPKKKKVPMMTSEDAKFQTSIAQGVAEDKKSFNQVMDRWIARKEVAKTTGTQKAVETAVPANVAQQTVKDIESGAANKYGSNIRAAYDDLYKHAQALGKETGQEVAYRKNYLTHAWKESPEQVEKTMKRVGKKFGYANAREIPTYEEGIKLGLTPRFENPGQMVGEYARKLEDTKANLDFFKELKDGGYIVPASVGHRTPGFVPVNAEGFPLNTTSIDGEKITGQWFAPKDVADQINKVFNPPAGGKIDKTFNIGAKVSSKAQDVLLSGGVPKTPINAFTVAQITKEVLGGRIKSPITSIIRSLDGGTSKKFFQANVETIKKMQERNIPLNSEFNLDNAVDRGWVKNTFGNTFGEVWSKTVNTPTFKRFMPMLQVNLFNDIERAAIKAGKPAQEAADIAGQAVRNFYGLGSTGKAARASKLGKDVVSTTLFAPRYRESMLNFWVNNIKNFTKNPLALENRTNTTFMVGATAMLIGMNQMNQAVNGHSMSENPDGKTDKLLIPLGNGKTIGIPFLSSIATLPRMAYNTGKAVLDGDMKTAGKQLSSNLSVPLRPLADVIGNENYFGSEIYDENDLGSEKLKKAANYLGNPVTGAYTHPYLREGTKFAQGKQGAVESLSKATELPIRWYNTKSIENAPFWKEYENQKKLKDIMEKAKYGKMSQAAVEKQLSKISGKSTVSDGTIIESDNYVAYKTSTGIAFADTRKEAELAIAKDKFKTSDKIFQVQGDQVFRKNKNGDVSVTSKLEYDENLNYRKLNIAKDSKNFKTWGELAVKQLDYYKQQLEDPTLDELEALDIMDRYATLTREMQKYGGYGGFTKPKAGKKAKKLNISLGSMSDTPTTTKRFATPKFASPKIAGLKNVRVKVAGLKAPKKSSGGGLKPVRGRGIKIVK